MHSPLPGADHANRLHFLSEVIADVIPAGERAFYITLWSPVDAEALKRNGVSVFLPFFLPYRAKSGKFAELGHLLLDCAGAAWNDRAGQGEVGE